jgi:protein TonB
VRHKLAIAVFSLILAATAQAQSGDVYKIGNGVKAPELVKEVKPQYTKAAMDRKVQGSVEMEAVILEDGSVGDTRITRSLDDDLDQEAVKALRQWRFKPGTKDGKAVRVQVEIELTFTLRDKR